MSFLHRLQALTKENKKRAARLKAHRPPISLEALELRIAPAVVPAYVDDDPGTVVGLKSPLFTTVGDPVGNPVPGSDDYIPVVVYGGKYAGFVIDKNTNSTTLQFVQDADPEHSAQNTVSITTIGPITTALSLGKTLTWQTDVPTTITLVTSDDGISPQGIIKTGSSTLKLTGINTYLGTTQVNAGTVIINGSNTAPTTVNSGATLGGTGSVTGLTTVNSGGSLSPGESGPGLFKAAATVFNVGSIFQVELNGTVAGTNYDQLELSAAPNLTNLNLSATLGFTPGSGTSFTIINNTSANPVVGKFANDLGGVVTIGGKLFAITYTGGTGNDVVLTSVPTNVTYVDDSFAGSTANQVVNVPPPGYSAVVFGVNAFTTIQEAINAVDAGGDIIVFGGSYPATVNVNKVLGTIKLDTNTFNGTTTSEKSVTIGGAITLGQNAAFQELGSLNHLTFGSTIDGGNSLSVTGSATTTFSGQVGNTTPLALISTDAGGSTVFNTTVIKTSGTQSYGDAVTLSAGAALTTSNNSVTFTSTVNGGQSLTVNTGTASTTFTTTVGATTPLTSLSVTAATTNLGGNVTTTGSLSITSNVALTSAVTLAHGTTMTVAGTTFALGGNTLTVDAGGAGSISNAITGTGGLTKQGTGSLKLTSSSSSYSGTTTVLNGALLVGADAPSGANGALGNSTGQVLLGDTSGSNPASLLFDGSFSVGRAILVRAGSSGTATLGNNAAAQFTSFSGNITLEKDVTLVAPTGSGGPSFSGVISQSGGSRAVTKTGGGIATLSGLTANTFTGLTTVAAGTLLLSKPNGVNAIGGNLTVLTGAFGQINSNDQIPDTSSINVNGTGRFRLDINNERVATLTGDGEVTFGAVPLGIDNTFTVGDATNFTFAGTFTGDDPGPFDRIVKTGNGTMTFSGNNTFTGRVDVNQGTFLLNGSFSTTSTGVVTVASGATLGGTGSANRPVNVLAGGHLSPGTSPGIFTVDSVSMVATSTFDVELNGATVGTQYDQLIVDAGAVDLGGATLNASRLASFVPGIGTSFTIINKTSAGAVTGTFAQGSSVVIGGMTFAINYAGGDGNDVVLTVANPTGAHVDDSFAGSTVGNAPVNDPVGGLVFGYNAFLTIQEGIDAVTGPFGQVFVYGGTYGAAINVNEPDISIRIHTNPNVPAETDGVISGAVTLSTAASFHENAAENDLTFGSTIDGGFSLTITGSATTTFAGTVGGTTPLLGIGTNAGGTTVLAANISAGSLSHGDDVILAADVTITAGGDVNFIQTVNGSHSLTINAGSGIPTFFTTVGGTTPLTSLTTTAGNTRFGGDVTTTGAISVTGRATLLGNVTLTHVGANSLTVSGGSEFNLSTFTLTDNSAGSGSISNPLIGGGSLVKTGGGVLSLSGAGSYTGGTLIRSGTIQVSHATGLGTNTVTLNDASTGANNTSLLATAGVTIANNLVVSNNGSGVSTIGTTAAAGATTYSGTVSLAKATTFQGAGTSTTFTGVIGGAAGTITVRGGSLTAFEAANTFSANVTVTDAGSTLLVGKSGGGDENQIPDATNVQVDTGAAFRLAFDDETINALNGSGIVGSATGGGAVMLTVSSGLFTGVLQNAGANVFSLYKTTGGTLTLSGTNTYTGGTTISQGTIVAQDNGSALGTGAVTINDAATGANNTSLLVNQTISVQRIISNTVTVANQGTGTVTIGTQTYNVGPFNATFTGLFTLNKATTLTSGHADQTVYDNVITGPVGLITVTGGSRTNWQGNNTFVGEVEITGAGTILAVGRSSVDNRDQIPDGSEVEVGAGTILQLVGDDSEVIDALTGTGTVRSVSSNPLTLTVGAGGGSGSFGGVIQNNTSFMSLVKTGAGTQTLTGANTYTGGTTIIGGVLSVSADANLGGASGGVTINGATLATTATFTLSATRALGFGTSSGTIDVAAGTTLTYNGVAADSGGAGGLIKAGTGTLVLGGANTYSGTTSINTGTLRLGASNVIPDGAGKGDVSVAGGATFDLAAFSDTINGLSGTGTVDGSASTFTVGANNQSSTFGGVITDTTGTLALTKTGTGTLNLTGANTYSGATLVAAGTLLVNGSITSNVTVTGTLGGGGTITGSVTGSGTVAPGNSPGLLTIIGNFGPVGAIAFEVNGLATPGTDFDRINVTGSVDLSGTAMTFSGTTAAPAVLQTITLINNDAGDPLVSNGATTPADGATVTINGHSFKLFHRGGDGNDLVLVSAAAPSVVYVDDSFTQNPGQAVTDADLGNAGNQGAIFGVSAFTTVAAAIAAVTPGGTVIVNAGSYVETATLDSGKTLRVTGPDAAQAVTVSTLSSNAGTTIDIQASSSLTLGDAGSQTLAGLITGTGSLTKQGAGTLTIQGNNVGYSGQTRLNAGTLDVQSDNALGTGNSALAGGTIQSSNGTRVLNLNFVAEGDFAVAGTNPITLGGAGKTFDLNAGIRTVTVGAGSTLTLDSTVQNGGLTKQGAGTLALTKANTFVGGLTLGSGLVQLSTDASAGVGTFTINGGSVEAIGGTRNLVNAVSVGGDFSIVGTQSLVLSAVNLTGGTRTITVDATQPATMSTVSNGGLTKSGAGTLNLTGVSTYVGATTVSAGRLNVNGSITSNVTVAGILGGAGTITGSVSGTGSVRPGNSAGLLTINGNLGPVGSLEFEVNGYTPNVTQDQIAVNGKVDLTGVNWTFLGTPPAPSPFQVVTLIANDLADPTVFGGGNLANGASVTIGGVAFNLFYNSGDGNDVVLIASATPGTVYVDDNFVGLLAGTPIADADQGTTNNQAATFGVDAFATLTDALAAVAASGTIIVNGGSYGESITINGTRTLRVTGLDAAQTVSITSLDTIAGTTLNVQGTSSLTIGDGSNHTLAGGIVGSGSLTKTGAGKLTVTANNGGRTGATTLSGGTLDVQDNNALGTGLFTIGNTTVLQSTNGARVLNQNVVFVGDFSITGGNQVTLGGAGKTVTLGGTRTVTIGAGESLVLDGVVQTGALVKQGAGTLSLTQANTFAGGLTLGAGALKLSTDTSAGSGTFTINGGSVEGVGGTRTLTNSVSVGGNFSIAGTQSLVLNGGTNLGGATRTITVDATQPATMSTVSNGGLTKSGAGTLNLTGASTYVGATTVSAGRLNVNGSITSNVTVSAGATLGGVGTITGNVNSTGNVAPGQSVGVLTITGNLTASAGELQFEVNSPYTTAGTDYDQIIVGGSVSLAGATLTLTGGGAATPQQVVKLISKTSGGATTPSTNPAEGSTVLAGLFRIFYNGGDGNDVVLVENSTPATVFVDDGFTGLNNGQVIADADPVAGGPQPAVFGVNAFTGVNAGITAVATGGLVIVNAGNYSGEAVNINKALTMRLQEGPISFGSLDDSVSTATVNLNGITLTTGGNNASTQFDSRIRSSGSMVKVGTGTFVVTGSTNDYSGGTTLSAGTLDVQDNSALGTGTFSIGGSAVLQSSNAARVLNLNVVVTGDFSIDGGNPITLAGAGKAIDLSAATRTITVGSGQSLTLDGTVQNGGLIKQGGGTLALTQANTFAGGLSLGAGALKLSADTSAGTGTFAINGGSVEAVGGTRTLANLVSVGGDFSVVGANNLVLAGDMSLASGVRTVTVTGALQATFGGVVSSGGLVKAGVGTLILGGANTYALGTTVNAGTLLVNNTAGSGTGSGSVVVNGAATLGGSGTASGLVGVNASGHLAPGPISGTGVLTTGTVGFSAAASFDVEINGNTPGTEHDQLKVVGGVSLNGVPLNVSLGFVPTPGVPIMIIDNDGTDPVVGTFAQGSTIIVGGFTFDIIYNAGNGNDVALIVQIPSVKVFVDDTWVGTATGANPANNPTGMVLTFGTDAFSTIQDAINSVSVPAGAIIVVFGGTYGSVNLTKPVTTFEITTNSTTPAQTAVSIGAFTLNQDASFTKTDSTTLTFTSTVNGSEDLAVGGVASLTTFSGAVGGVTPLGDGAGAALSILSGPVTFNSSVATRSGIVTGPGAVAFNSVVTVSAVAGATPSSFGGNVTITNTTFATSSANPGEGNATFSGATLTLGGAGARLQVSGAAANTILVNSNVVGSGSAPLIVNTNSTSAVILAGASNTFAGGTSIEAGKLTVNGVLTAGGGGIALLSNNTTLSGSGTINQRAVTVNSGVTGATIQGVKLMGPGAATANVGITIGLNANAQIGGSAAGEPITISGWGTGVSVPTSTSSVKVLGGAVLSAITGNRIGIDVNAGKAFIQKTDLSNNTIGGSDGISNPSGLRARNGARVDAGQVLGGVDFTALNGGGVGQGSTGGNKFDGYGTFTAATLPTVSQAILNLNTNSPNNAVGPQGLPHDLMAQANTFDGSNLPSYIEDRVFHDYNGSTFGFVNYVTPGGMLPSLVGDPILYSVTPTAAANNNFLQRSMIRFIRLGFDNFVAIDQSAVNAANRGVVVSRTGGFNATALTPLYTGVINTVLANPIAGFNPFATDGRYFTYDFRFTGTGVEVSGSLGDGDYSITFNSGMLKALLGTPVALPTVTFHRLFGDANSNMGSSTYRRVDAIDAALLTNSMNSRRGMANYREYLDFDNNGYIDLQDQTAFNRRLNKY